MAPLADLTLPWDDADAPAPVDALRRARAELGDTFEVVSGGDRYLFVFSAVGLRSFYALAEREASKGLADYRMLLRKLPPELFDGRRTFAHDLFGRQEVETYLDRLDTTLGRELDRLGGSGTFDAFALGRRLGHLLGLACWIGPDGTEALIPQLDRLDGADAFVHPETVAAVRATDYVDERRALAAVEEHIAALLARPGRPPGFLGEIADRWDDVDEPARSVGVARDVVLLHVATLTNLVAAIGWTLVRVLTSTPDPQSERSAESVEQSATEAIRLAQRSIMMRTALRDLDLDDGVEVHRVERGTIVATMLPVTNLEPDPPLVTTFGHGEHRCPAKRFSTTAIVRTVEALWDRFELSPVDSDPPASLDRQIGGVGRPAGPWIVSYRERAPR